MYRIAHISDLHISDITPSDRTALQWLGEVLLAEGSNVKVEADKHSDHKLTALRNAFRSLRPNLIVVTGDVTNYGDRQSFDLAARILADLQKTARAERVVCIPGNHDSLCERVADLRNRGLVNRLLIAAIALFNKETAHMRKTSLDPEVKRRLEAGRENFLLNNYESVFTKDTYGDVNPRAPVFVDAGWAEVALFLFNSTNDPGYMANEGCIGEYQFNALNEYLDDPANRNRIARAVRIALLHHHPINVPTIDATKVERGYNSMIDGERFRQYLGERKFHFILHGHQHEPYVWQSHPDFGAHVVAAGSAIAGDAPRGSFNVIDLYTPYHTSVRRFDYKQTGYKEAGDDGVYDPLPIKSIEDIRVTPSDQAVTGEDQAMRELFKSRIEAHDERHRYDLLEYDVTVSPAQLYTGRYRRAGQVVIEEDERNSGMTYVITGNPPMSFAAMGVAAADVAGGSLAIEVDPKYEAAGTQKVFTALHPLPLKNGDSFDITMQFHWQASDAYPNHFDGVNLMYFKHPVGRLKYRARLPWKPAYAKVIAYGLDASNPTLAQQSLAAMPGGTYEYSFEINEPDPLAYLITFKP